MVFGVRKSPNPVLSLGKNLSSLTTRLAVPTALSSAEFAPCSFMVAGAGGVEAYVTASVTCAGWVYGIYDKNGQVLDFEYVDATAAAAAVHYVDLLPAGGIQYELGEDADGGSLADSDVGSFVSLVVGTIGDTPSTSNVPIGRSTPNILIDSSSVAASASGAVQWQLISCETPTVRSASVARIWRVQIAAAAATYTL